jgi:hypothetical protein
VFKTIQILILATTWQARSKLDAKELRTLEEQASLRQRKHSATNTGGLERHGHSVNLYKWMRGMVVERCIAMRLNPRHNELPGVHTSITRDCAQTSIRNLRVCTISISQMRPCTQAVVVYYEGNKEVIASSPQNNGFHDLSNALQYCIDADRPYCFLRVGIPGTGLQS